MESVGAFPRRLVSVSSWLLALILALASIAKLRAMGEFHQSVLNFRWIGDPGAAWVALILPWTELGIAIGLMFRRTRRVGAWLTAQLAVFFLAAVAQAWVRGIDLNCGCFGSAIPPLEPMAHVIGLTLLGASAVWVAREAGPKLGVERRG